MKYMRGDAVMQVMGGNDMKQMGMRMRCDGNGMEWDGTDGNGI